MAFKLFGFSLRSPSETEKQSTGIQSVIPPANEDAALTTAVGGVSAFLGQYTINFSDFIAFGTSEVDLVNTYRSLSLQPEVDEAISDIIQEMIIKSEDKESITINTDKLPQVYDDEFRDSVAEEFENVLHMLDFNSKSYDIAKQFYVDGRLYYDLVIDNKAPEKGVIELRNIDPRTIKPVREIEEKLDSETGARLTTVVNEYFIYNPSGITNTAVPTASVGTGGTGTRVAKDRIAYINSGIFTPGNVQVLSHLHKAIKPFNQLRMIEDATVIYRITRAPERRVFYVDVGDLPKKEADTYVQNMANQYRNRMTYSSADGKVADDRKVQSILEDFFLPRRGSTGKGTEVETLPAGQNLGEMDDVEYFKRKLYRALNIPLSRIEKDGGTFQLGRVAEISRDEIKYSRFLIRIRERLSMLFDEILAKHLTLKRIIKSQQEWYELKRYINYDFIVDSHFNELKENEIMASRLDVVAKIDPYIGRYFSDQFIRDKILKQTREEQTMIDMSLEQDPHQLPAMILPKNAEGMRPADPIAAGLEKLLSPGADVPNHPDVGKNGKGAGPSGLGGKSAGGLGSGFASKSDSVVKTAFGKRNYSIKVPTVGNDRSDYTVKESLLNEDSSLIKLIISDNGDLQIV